MYWSHLPLNNPIMATKKKATKAVKTPAKEFVTKEEFEELNGSVNRLVDMLEKQMNATALVTPVPLDPIQEKAIDNAGPNSAYTTDSEWDQIAKDIIGEAVDHTELERKGGGIKFTVVIKPEFSNASKEYLERMKTDRRTREVGGEGSEGVTQYCKLIKANLARAK